MTPNEKKIVDSWQQRAPVDITAMATDLGLSVYESYELPPGVSGKICLDSSGESPSGYVIAVNANEAYRRRRFTIAHECAHYLLHRSKIGDELIDDAIYRSEKLNTKEEFEANNLAADLLMPQRLVNDFIRQGISGVDSLAEQFDVSGPAMKVRLRYLYQLEYA
jgi:hypothetical protein